MYNKGKYLTDKIGGIIAIVVGGLSLIFALISAFSIISTCVAVSAMGGYGFILVVSFLIRITINVIFIFFGAKTCYKPYREMYGTVKINSSKQYKYVYGATGCNVTLVVLSLLMGILGFFVGGDIIDFGSMYIISIDGVIQILVNLIYLVIAGLKITTLCIKDENVFDNKGNLLAVNTRPVQQPVQFTNQSVQQPVQFANQPVQQPIQFENQPVEPVAQSSKKADSLENKIKELKHLKELGVLDDTQYEQALERIIRKEAE